MKKNNPFEMPRQEDVQDFDVFGNHISLVKITDRNRANLKKVVTSMGIGQKCKYCLREYQSLKDLEQCNVVFAGEHEFGTLACKECFSANN